MKLSTQHLNIVTKTINRNHHKHSYMMINSSKMHYSFLFEGYTLIKYGTNFVKHFSTNDKFVKTNTIHSEVDCVSNVNFNNLTMSQLSLINVRVNQSGEFRNSAPCKACQSLLNKIKIKQIYFSTENGFIKF